MELTDKQNNLLLKWITKQHIFIFEDDRGVRIKMLTYDLNEVKLQEILNDFSLDALENGGQGRLELFLRFR